MSANHNLDFLNRLYKYVTTDIESIKLLIDKAKDPDQKNDLIAELQDYRNIAGTIELKLSEYQEAPKEIDTFTKTGLWSSVQLNTLMNQSSNHIAQMIIKGDETRIYTLEKDMKDHPDIDSDVREIGVSLLMAEKNHKEHMRYYL